MSRKEFLFAVLLLSAQALGQTNPVYQNPAAGASQPIVQLPDPIHNNPSSFSVNNEAGIRYSVGYNWVPQPPTVNLMAGMASTVPLSPCPAGLVAPFTYIWIADNNHNISEAVALSSTTCLLQGTGSGTVTSPPRTVIQPDSTP